MILDLKQFAGQDVFIAFWYDGQDIMKTDWLIDDVEIYKLYKRDAGVSKIIAPVNGIEMKEEAVSISIKNYGTKALSDIPVTLKIDGEIITTEIGDMPVSTENEITYTFKHKADFTAFKLAPFMIFINTVFEGDSLIVYEGNKIAPERCVAIMTDSLNNQLPYTITSHTPDGSLTFVFRKVSVADTEEGWEADISCVVPEPKDVGVRRIVTPQKGGNSASNVIVKIQNYGSEPASNFDLAYEFNEETIVKERFIRELAPGEITEYTFGQPIDLSAYSENYRLSVYTLLEGDADVNNDKLSTTYFYRENVELYGFRLWDGYYAQTYNDSEEKLLPEYYEKTYKKVSFNSNEVTNIDESDIYDFNTYGAVTAGTYGKDTIYAFTADPSTGEAKYFIQFTKNWEIIKYVSAPDELFPSDMTYDYQNDQLLGVYSSYVSGQGIRTLLLKFDKETGEILEEFPLSIPFLVLQLMQMEICTV